MNPPTTDPAAIPPSAEGSVGTARWTPAFAVRVIFASGILYHLLWLLVSTIPLNPGADSDRYLNNAYQPGFLFSDIAAPGGYSVFLKVIGWFPERALLILIAQHALALLTAWLLWLLARRIADRLHVSRWWAVPAPAFGAFNGDLTFFSHTAMTETLSFTLFVITVVLAERLTATSVVGDRRRLALVALGFGGVVALSQCVRTANGPVAVALLLTLLIWVPTFKNRATVVAAALAAAAVVMGGYLFAVDQSYSKQAGLGGIQGWLLYGRTSSFADCKKSPPAPDLRKLCDKTPRKDRYGAFYYNYARSDIAPENWSPAIKAYGGIPNHNDDLQRYSLNVIKHQPFDYLAVVIHEMGRYVAPNAGHNPFYSTPGPEFEEITGLPFAREGVKTFEFYGVDGYRPGPLAASAEWWLEVSRFPPLLVVSFLLLPFAVLPRVRSRELNATMVPLWIVGMASAALPVLLVSYEYRYGLPTQMLLSVSGPLTFAAFLRERRRRSASTNDG